MLPRSRQRDALGHFLCLVVSFTVQFRTKDSVTSLAMKSPRSQDFKTCRLTAEEKEKFLDENNKFRGMVQPTAADMEFLVWDDNLANMAQMWADKCIWDHGFVMFGSQYPYSVPFKGQIGQNLAREYGELSNPVDRVVRWYNEHKYWIFGKYTSPMGASCRKSPCGHYTQLAWAQAKHLGCAVNFCSSFNDGVEGTMVACDYTTGNIGGQYPYKAGTPCTKCASGKGWCYKNLCRNCTDFDKDCGGTSLTAAMCSSHPELMEKKCPKLCNMCKCPLKCQNGGTLNEQDCVCSCASGWRGMDCSDKACEPGYYGENCENRCYDKAGTETCQYRVKAGFDCKQKFMEIDCALTCGYCVPAGGQVTTTAAPVTAMPTTPQPGVITSKPVVSATVTPNAIAVLPTPKPQVCKTDQNSGCEGWAAVGECEKNPLWMIPNCCVSCRHHQAPKDCTDANPSCSRWAYAGECEKNRLWMLKNCRKSCNQCGDCTDSDPRCPSWALSNQCNSGEKIHEKCRRSCGLCKVYDRHNECPAWSAMDECKKSNWTWMADHCPRSCDVPFSEASFCGGKENGNYQAPTTCQAFMACSNGVTSHVKCPTGKKFDTVRRICVLVDQAACTVVFPSKKSKPFMIMTL